jgi:hypothetical protein
MFKKKLQRLIAVTIAIITLFTFSSSAIEASGNDDWRSKICAELWKEMQDKAKDDLILVNIWLRSVDEKVITEAMINEKGMNPAIYEDETRFNEEIVPEVARQVVERVGYEAAYFFEPIEQVGMEESATEEFNSTTESIDGPFFDQSISLVDRAINAKVDEYVMAKREITKREYSALNDNFIKNNIGKKQRDIIFNGRYVSSITMEATKFEIEAYAKNPIVEDISLYVELFPTSSLNVAPGQVGASSSTGDTKSNSFNNGSGFRGTGVKIGIIEVKGQYHSSAPHLSGLTNLSFHNDAGLFGGTVTVDTSDVHATVVTSIIVGKSITMSGSNLPYEGIVPLATVYQTPIVSNSDVERAIEKLADKGASVINYSGGTEIGNGYYVHDRRVDEITRNTGVTFVHAAGNTGGNVDSPGKALNVITIGNAQTIAENTYLGLSDPFLMRPNSSYVEASYLPNKPNISAPGTRIRVVRSTTGTDNFYYSNGANANGTSFSAPIVTGIVAQMMQARPWLKIRPTAVKADLILGARPGQVRSPITSPADNTNISAGSSQWDKSGAGHVNARNAVRAALNTAGTYEVTFGSSSNPPAVSNIIGTFSTGQRIRIVLVFDKRNTGGISNQMDMDDIDIELIRTTTGAVERSSLSTRNNVEIIEHTFTATTMYSIRVNPYRFRNSSMRPTVYVSWMLVDANGMLIP